MSFFVFMGIVILLMAITVVNVLYLITGIKGGANGIFFDKNDRLYIASVFGGAIHIMDTRTVKKKVLMDPMMWKSHLTATFIIRILCKGTFAAVISMVQLQNSILQ